MLNVAFLSASCMMPESPNRRVDYWEHDFEFIPIARAARSRGLELTTKVWDDPSLDPTAFDAFVIGTTWDYTRRPEAFLAKLQEIARARPLFNPLPVVRWNADKTYLRDLEDRGARVVATRWVQRADEAAARDAFHAFDTDHIVIKPTIGAGAWRQVRLARDDPFPAADVLPLGTAMIQPFMPSVTSEGEFSFLFFDGEFSHCAQKLPKSGDYRIQSAYGGQERVYTPSSAEIAEASRVLRSVDARLLYARVDMVRDAEGRLALMELELIEPYLYPEQGPELGENFASALARLLDV